MLGLGMYIGHNMPRSDTLVDISAISEGGDSWYVPHLPLLLLPWQQSYDGSHTVCMTSPLKKLFDI